MGRRQKATLSELLSGAQEAINDTYETFHFGAPDQSAQEKEWARIFLSRYKDSTGRDYFSDAGQTHIAAKKIIRRGHIETDDEFRLLNMFISDVEQGHLSTSETQSANKIMSQYEQSKQV